MAFRTAGAQHIGLGHVRRCLSLALALRVKGGSSVFLLDGDPDLCGVIEAEGFETRHIHIRDDVESTLGHCREFIIDAIVADSYALSTSYFQAMKGVVPVVAVLDDLADRELPVTLVVNGSAGADELHYRGGPNTKYLLGPRYIMLRPEFSEAPVTHTRDAIQRILITVGGSDPYGLTSRLIQWTDASLPDVKQDVVVGPLFSDTDALKEIARNVAGTITIHENPGEIRTLMLNADIALCGGGQTTYELAATGTPT
ncbi:MAG: UDP-2,4-diacetamido-2,4,6-trideoxy-beta-L-altropyranose hydrolase, partial [Nitrospira sp.]